jgi:hypothetical protein
MNKMFLFSFGSHRLWRHTSDDVVVQYRPIVRRQNDVHYLEQFQAGVAVVDAAACSDTLL